MTMLFAKCGHQSQQGAYSINLFRQRLSVVKAFLHDSHESGYGEGDLFSPLPFSIKMARPLTQILE